VHADAAAVTVGLVPSLQLVPLQLLYTFEADRLFHPFWDLLIVLLSGISVYCVAYIVVRSLAILRGCIKTVWPKELGRLVA
jgi:hypothetical protein